MPQARERRSSAGAGRGSILLPTLLLLLSLLPSPARAAVEWLATGTVAGGHDSNVLGRPGDPLSDGSQPQAFIELSPDLRGAWGDGRWSLVGAWTYRFNGYDSSNVGVVHDHLGQLEASWQASDAVTLAARGAGEWYRRPERDDFDFSRREGTLEGRWRPGGAWRLRAGISAGAITYPERTIAPLSSEEQRDDPAALELSAGFDPGRKWTLEGGVARVVNGSNSTQYDFAGWQTWAAAAFRPGSEWSLTCGITRERRHYDEFLRPARILGRPPRQVDRDDDATWLTLGVSRGVARGLSLFGDLTWLDYDSSEDGYSYDQALARAGFSLGIGSRPRSAPEQPGAAPATLLPRGTGLEAGATAIDSTASGVATLFRCRAPGARQVAVAGSFNGWKPAGHPMSDPDGDGTWEAVIRLRPGLHRYMFLVDGREWRSPEGAALYEDDGFGLMNAILEVPAGEGNGGGNR